MMNRLNIFQTLLLNIRAFGLWKGLSFPIYVYGKVRIYNMGRWKINCPMRRGLIKIGMNAEDTALPYTIINNDGVLEIHGSVWINHATRLSNKGTIVFAGNDIVGHACVFDIRRRIEIGRNVSIGYCSEFMDSDDHYLVDVESRKVFSNEKPIRIGDFNWLGSHTYVKKGAVTPDYTITASPNALLLKDYSSEIPPFTILGGCPAKPIGTGKRRVLNFKHQGDIASALKNKPCYEVDMSIDLDEFCSL